MYRLISRCLFIGLALAAPMVMAQSGASTKEPGRAVISLYRVAPGKHVAFLKWMAERDALDQQLGLPRAQWYGHFQGDSWDYIAIAPDLTDAQQKKEDDAAKAKGLAVGLKASLEFREFIAAHTDTVSIGPFTASDLAARASSP